MAQLTIDKIGSAYLSIAIIWTCVLFGGVLFLYVNRKSPLVKIRRLPLVFSAIALLHVYWFLVMIGYIIGPVVPCHVEYFTMSIYLPFGIALFQTANSQFLYIATQQTVFTRMKSLDDPSTIERRRSRGFLKQPGLRGLLNRYRHADKITKMTNWITIAMLLQVLLTIFISLISEKFHPGFGIVPIHLEQTNSEQRAACSRGWEWWSSIFWQFFWAWIYAPWILIKSRSIKDTHGWRLQTILCCLSGLPASPLWLAGLYSPKMAVVNKVFIPPMWFGLSIFLLQLFSVFIPCWSVLTYRALQQETLDAIDAWERRNSETGSFNSDATTNVSSPGSSAKSFQTLVAIESQRKESIDSRKDSMLNMAALDHALKWNPEPLQKFAALKDFAGENISFLTHLAEWKQGWKFTQPLCSSLPSEQSEVRAKKCRQQFNKAIRIYAAFISLRYAEFPINLPAKQLTFLENVFNRSTTVIYGSDTSQQSIHTEIAPFAHPDEVDKAALVSTSELGRADLVWYWGPIPPEFDENVFNAAEKEIRYLVLTNTWPKFVHDGWLENCKVSTPRRFGKYVSRWRWRRVRDNS